MLLKMYLCEMLIEKCEFDFVEMESLQEKSNHIKNIAADMYERNIEEVRQARTQPVFYYEFPSRMNDATFDCDELEGKSWGDIKMQIQVQTIKDV